jgi:hypothetical protein
VIQYGTGLEGLDEEVGERNTYGDGVEGGFLGVPGYETPSI